ncbi:hypothetical protein GCM10012275_25360 [Longimycelium tulufanense]|uniref:Uncharacterized protein n=1 Tax=Longimycelium tulufanense TaxID=907463 RepID=A0A8J3CCH0_9PSEU|nr:MscL family protein [Longimycelium tulufanense]GGM53307.1 hypothetical protein GCM10012275_25360 [Longimycelium tulufanense]
MAGPGRGSGTTVSAGGLVEVLVGAGLGAVVACAVQLLARDVILARVTSALGQPEVSRLSLQAGQWRLQYGSVIASLINFLVLTSVAFAVLCSVRWAARWLRQRRAGRAADGAEQGADSPG